MADNELRTAPLVATADIDADDIMPYAKKTAGTGLFGVKLSALKAYFLAGGGGSLPAGGIAGQVLTKIDATDGHADWQTPTGGGGGGGAGGSGGPSWDYEYPIDKPPLVPNAFDDEFNGSALDPAWTWFNQVSNGATGIATVSDGALMLTADVPIGGQNPRMLFKPKPVGDFDIICKARMDGVATSYPNVTLAVYNSVNHRHENVRIYWNGGLAILSTSQWEGSGNTGGSSYDNWITNVIYLRIRVIGNTLSFMASMTGKFWQVLGTRDITSMFATGFDSIGLSYDTENSNRNYGAIYHYVRNII